MRKQQMDVPPVSVKSKNLFKKKKTKSSFRVQIFQIFFGGLLYYTSLVVLAIIYIKVLSPRIELSLTEYYWLYVRSDDMRLIDYVLNRYGRLLSSRSSTTNITTLNLDIKSQSQYNYHNIFTSLGLNINYSSPIYFRYGFLFLLTTTASLVGTSYLGLYGVFCLNSIPLFLFWSTCLIFFYQQHLNTIVWLLDFGKWFVFNHNTKVHFLFYIDWLSLSYTSLTLTIAFFVYFYCFSYFRGEPHVERLLLLINLFVLSMILLVSSGNTVVMFLGWELIGLTSFFLINFWSTRIGTLKAAFKAFVFNKFSDIAILLFIISSFLLVHDFDFLTINNQILFYINVYINILGMEFPVIELLSLLLVTAALIKSAQFGTHIWLPDSMEAPVPASALIHSATLVSAGVFLFLRFNYVVSLSCYAYYVIPFVGSITAFFGGFGAVYQSDIKKILAYSTISHCGFLSVIFSTYNFEFTLLYLYIHGFFKATVFLCVGNVIRFSKNYQDFRRMGGFYKYLPFECLVSMFCLINLSGLPFSLGFYIKHLLLLAIPSYWIKFILFNVLLGAISGIIYSFRLFYYVFFDIKKLNKKYYSLLNQQTSRSFIKSNTTKANYGAIFGLFMFSYIISFFFFKAYNNTAVIFTHTTAIFDFTSHSLYNQYNLPKNLKNRLSIINFIVLFFILILFLLKWRKTFNYHTTILGWSFSIVIVFFYCIVDGLLSTQVYIDISLLNAYSTFLYLFEFILNFFY